MFYLGDELKIVTGALDIHRKTVKDIMTKIEDVFMLSADATLNVNLVADIVRNGYTRIPVRNPDIIPDKLSLFFVTLLKQIWHYMAKI